MERLHRMKSRVEKTAVWKLKDKIFLGISIVLTIPDIVTDIMLAIDYCSNGETQWCLLTFVFISPPLLLLFVLSVSCCWLCVEKQLNGDNLLETGKFFKAWKAFEAVVESGPQLVLQLYIVTLPPNDPAPVAPGLFVICRHLSQNYLRC